MTSENTHKLMGLYREVLDMPRPHQLVVFSEMTAKSLSNDNSLMREELDSLRGRLLEQKKMVASLEAQLQNSPSIPQTARVAPATQTQVHTVARYNVCSGPSS